MTARDLERLGEHAARELDRVSQGAAPDLALRARLAQRAAAPSGGRSRARLLGAVAVAATVLVAAGIFLFRSAPEAKSLAFRIGDRAGVVGEWIAPGGQAGVSLRFSEGSRVALDPGTRASVARLDERGAEVVMSSGVLHADVVPRAGNAWRVRTGPFLVEVKGTRFDVSWDERADTFELVLFEGHVVVSGCSLGTGRSVVAGERVSASCRPPSRAAGTAPSAPTLGTTPAERQAPRALGAPAASRAPSADWTALARSGHYDRAYALAVSAGLETLRAERASDEVLLLGETARLTGHLDEARRSYQAVRRRFGSTPAGARAAFDLGRLEAAAGHSAASATWFETYLGEQPQGPFAAAALGRLLEARVDLGDRARATETARTYLKRYPTGAHAEAARKVLGGDAGGRSE